MEKWSIHSLVDPHLEVQIRSPKICGVRVKYIFSSLLVFFLFSGCINESDRSVVLNPQLPPPPVQPEEPAKPKPEPTPIYACRGIDQFSKIEIWWSKSTPIAEFFLGKLDDCENHTSDTLDMVVRYHAQGTTVNVDGESKNFG